MERTPANKSSEECQDGRCYKCPRDPRDCNCDCHARQRGCEACHTEHYWRTNPVDGNSNYCPSHCSGCKQTSSVFPAIKCSRHAPVGPAPEVDAIVRKLSDARENLYDVLTPYHRIQAFAQARQRAELEVKLVEAQIKANRSLLCQLGSCDTCDDIPNCCCYCHDANCSRCADQLPCRRHDPRPNSERNLCGNCDGNACEGDANVHDEYGDRYCECSVCGGYDDELCMVCMEGHCKGDRDKCERQDKDTSDAVQCLCTLCIGSTRYCSDCGEDGSCRSAPQDDSDNDEEDFRRKCRLPNGPFCECDACGGNSCNCWPRNEAKGGSCLKCRRLCGPE
jgi:hypothetical protein